MRTAVLLAPFVLLVAACADAPREEPEPREKIETTPQTETTIEGSDLPAPGS